MIEFTFMSLTILKKLIFPILAQKEQISGVFCKLKTRENANIENSDRYYCDHFLYCEFGYQISTKNYLALFKK